MKTSLLIIVGICRIASLQARFTTTYSTSSPNLQTESKPPVRLVRDAFDDESLTGFSREEDGLSNEFVQSYNRRSRYFYKYGAQSPPTGTSVARRPRGSSGNNSINKTEIYAVSANPQYVLIKKPIPKFNDGDYEDDFQSKIDKTAKFVADSGEHEDEDFNLDDYDFDVNHDEFISRGKPLEPRIKLRDIKESRVEQYELNWAVKTPKPKPERKLKINIPSARILVNKKERAVRGTIKKMAEKIKQDDYYEDMNTKEAAKGKVRDADDEFTDDNEESKEFDQKRPIVRTARSPWNLHLYTHKLGEKSPSTLARLLSILPMFPQTPKVNK